MKSLSDYKSKKVYSSSGEYIGKIYDLLFSKYELIAIVIKRKNRKIVLSRKYIKYNTSDMIVLNIDPVVLIIGKEVYDVEGKKLGKVVSIERNEYENEYKSIVVKKYIFSKGLNIPKRDIEVIERNIILNTSYGD